MSENENFDFQSQTNEEVPGIGLDPRLTLKDQGLNDYEELYPPIEHVLETADIVFLAVRCAIIGLYLVCMIVVIIDISSDKLRLKSWRLYLVVCLVLFCWLGLSIYYDHIDEYFVQEIYRFPQRRSIYWLFRNLVHGLTLYLIILLLSHLSDFQHRGWWLLLIFAVVIVPIAYSVALLVIDLRLDPDLRVSWEWNVGIDTVRVFLYNVLTSILLLGFSPRFCTRILFGSYSENRSPVVVLISRWSFAFLLLHNFTAIASYGAAVTSRVPPAAGTLINVEKATIVHRALEEGLLLMIVLAVPVSYVIGMIGQCCFGGIDEGDLEMNKVDMIYQEVWTAPSGRRVTTTKSSSAQKSQVTTPATDPVNTNPGAARGRTGGNINNGRQNGAPRSRQGSTSSSTESLGAADFVLAKPSDSNKSLNANQAAIAGQAAAAEAQKKKKNRESYMEAISMGSMQEIDGRHSRESRTSEPIDL